MRQLEPRQFNSIITLLVGLVAGLLLGLFIGWVAWPVEWQGATLNELFPSERAEYLGAVADAFALDRSPEAATLAGQRLAALGNNLSSEMEAAVAYFSNSADPNRDLRINNLTFLASSLGVSTPGLVGVTQNAPADNTAADTSAAVTTPTETSNATTSSWLTWLLYVLAGLLLILLGLYLILRLRQQRSDATPTSEYIDREISSLQNASADPWAQRTQSYVAAEDDPAYAMADTQDDDWQQAANTQTVPEDYSFDDDPEEPAHVRPGVRNWVGANRGNHVAQLRFDGGEEEVEEEDLLEEEDDEAESPPPYRPAAGVAAPNAAAIRQPSEPTNTPEATPLQSRLESRPALAPRSEGSLMTAPFNPERAVGAARPLAKHKLLEIYTAQYQVGLHDYDESHPILDPAAGKYVGECGMGTSTKNGLLQNHPDQVLALEVWLFDKTDEKNVGTQTRVLLSEYAIDHNLVQAFTKERQDDPRPFTAQPNTRFQLESQNLLLDCTITEATYIPSGPTKGIFQNVTVEMSVYKKG